MDHASPKCWNRRIISQVSKAQPTNMEYKISLFCLQHRHLRWKIREYFYSFVPLLLFIGGLSFSAITLYINVLSCHYCVQLITRCSSSMLSYLPNVIVILILHLNYTVFVNAHQWTESVREADNPSALQKSSVCYSAKNVIVLYTRAAILFFDSTSTGELPSFNWYCHIVVNVSADGYDVCSSGVVLK